jgi:hypothetical protein
MAIFDKLQSMSGNFVSRLGGANVLSPEQEQQLTALELQAYNQQKQDAKTAGMRELSARLSDAFGGRDIGARSAIRRLDIEKKSERDRTLKLQQDLQQAISSGDMDTAYAISAQLQPGSVAQNIIQSQAGPSKKDLQPQISPDGTYTIFKDYDEATGQYVPRLEVNQKVIDAQRQATALDQRDKPLPSATIEKEVENKAVINSFQYQNDIIDNFIKQAKDNNLQFGFTEPMQDFIGNLGIGAWGEESKTRLANKNAFERWKQSYVNTVLQAAKGPQTDGDARRALEQLSSANTPEAVVSLLKDIKRANDNEINFNKSSIDARRTNFGKDAIYGNVEFKILKD